ncbi:DUF397 domain-containing protein [Microbispora hainanensis]|jgi:hypothetical protein|uniref:DUF397 domain-containing protein n=1 Tax=Microbispora hainanensis TaxID=568844 RepID=UPI003AF39D44
MDLGAALWRKSSISGDNGGQCVEVATNLPGTVAVRDSKDPGGPKLLFTPTEWQALSPVSRPASSTSRPDLRSPGDSLTLPPPIVGGPNETGTLTEVDRPTGHK